MRPHGNLRLGEVRPIQRTADEQRFSFRFAVQYLRTLRAAARPDWKPGRGIFACGAPSGGNQFLVFCSEYSGWALFQFHAGRAQSKCVEVQAVAGRPSGGSASTASCTSKHEKEACEVGGAR